MVQSQQAEFPQAAVVYLTFFQSEFAADHLITSGGVALELDATNVKGLALIDVDIETDQFFGIIGPSVRNGSEVDVSELAIGLTHIFQALGNLFPAQNFAVLERK